MGWASYSRCCTALEPQPESKSLGLTQVQPHNLLLEDDPVIARSIIFTLERDGLRVTHCAVVADAHRQLALYVPSLLILDIGLPDNYGLDVSQAVRHSIATRCLPVL